MSSPWETPWGTCEGLLQHLTWSSSELGKWLWGCSLKATQCMQAAGGGAGRGERWDTAACELGP